MRSCRISPWAWVRWSEKIALARAFRGRGQVLVLDEPTASLDPVAEEAVFNMLPGSERRTLVVISHRYSTVRRAQRILVMDGGRLVEHGTHGSLLAAGGRYARMFRLQMEASWDDHGARPQPVARAR